MADKHPSPRHAAQRPLPLREPPEQPQTKKQQQEQLKNPPQRLQTRTQHQHGERAGGEASELEWQQTQRREDREELPQKEKQLGEGKKEIQEERLQEERLREEKGKQQLQREKRQQEGHSDSLQRGRKDMRSHGSLRLRAKETLEKHLGAMQVVSPIDPFPTAPRRETEVLVLEELPPDLTKKVAAELSKQRNKRYQKKLRSRTKDYAAREAPGLAAATAPAAAGGRGGKEKDDERTGGEDVEKEGKDTKGTDGEHVEGFNFSLPASFFSTKRLLLGDVERTSAAPERAASASPAAYDLPVGQEEPQSRLQNVEKKKEEQQQREEGDEGEARADAPAAEAKVQPDAAACAAGDVAEQRAAQAGGGRGGNEAEEGAEEMAAAGTERRFAAEAGEELLRGGADAVAERGKAAAAAERPCLLLVGEGRKGSMRPAEGQLHDLRQQRWQQQEQQQSSLQRGAWPRRYSCGSEAAGCAGVAASGKRQGGGMSAAAPVDIGGGAAWSDMAVEEGRRCGCYGRRDEETPKGKFGVGLFLALLSFFSGKRKKATEEKSFYLSPGGDTCSVCTRRSRFSFFSKDERIPALGGGTAPATAGVSVARGGGRRFSEGCEKRSASSMSFMSRLFPGTASEYSPPPMVAARLQATPCGINRFVLLAIYVFYALLTGRVYFAWPNISNLLFRSEAYLWLCEEDGPQGRRLGKPDLRLPEHGNRRYACEEQNARVQQLFVVCLASAYACALLAGLLLDKFGPKLTALFGQCCNCAAWLLLACASRSSQTYLPAFVVMGIGVDSGYMALLSVANLFPGHEGLIVATLGSAKSLSFAMPTILDAIEANSPSIKLREVSLAYAALGPGLCLIIALFLINFRPFLPWTSFIHIEEVMEEMEREKRQRASGWTNMLLLRSPSLCSVFSGGKKGARNVGVFSSSTTAPACKSTSSPVLHLQHAAGSGGGGGGTAAADASAASSNGKLLKSSVDHCTRAPTTTAAEPQAAAEATGNEEEAAFQPSSEEIRLNSAPGLCGSATTAAAAAEAAAVAAAGEAAAAATKEAPATAEAPAAPAAAAATEAAAATAAAAEGVVATGGGDAVRATEDATKATKETPGKGEEGERGRTAAAAVAAEQGVGDFDRIRGSRSRSNSTATRNHQENAEYKHTEEGRKRVEDKDRGKDMCHSGESIDACSPPYCGSFFLKIAQGDVEGKDKESEQGGLPCASDELAAPTLWQQLGSKYCLLMMGNYICQAVLYPFISTSAEELFGKEVNDFLGVALPFSCVACLAYGRLTDMYGIMRVLLLLHTTVALVYLLSLVQRAVASYIAATLLVLYVGFYSSQVYCFVNDTFAAAQFGRIVGVTFMVAGFFSLLKIPLHTLVVHVFHSKYTWPVVIMLSLCLFNYFLLGLLYIFKRRNPHPFWPQEAVMAAAVRPPAEEIMRNERAGSTYSSRHP